MKKLRELNSPEFQKWDDVVKSQIAFEKQKKSDPKVAEAVRFYSDGETMFKAGQLDKAIAAFRQAVKRLPTNSAYWCRLGIVHGRKGEVKDASDCFNKALKLDPHNADAWRNLGVLYKQQGKIHEAKTAAENAIRNDETNGLAWNDLGVILMSVKNFSQSAECFEAAVSAMPNYDTAWRNLGIAYCALNRIRDAERVQHILEEHRSLSAAEIAAAIEKKKIGR